MSTKTGTATNYFDLLTILRDFLCDQGHAWGLTYSGTGNGRLTGAIGTSASVVQTITCTATGATSFTVSGSVTGSMGTATVGTLFTHAQCEFTITAGGTAFVSGDAFAFNLSPKWTQLRWGGCGEAALRTSSASGVSAMFDADTSSNAISTSSLPVTITVQMQAAIEVKSFNIYSGSSTSTAPKDFSLQWSDDGSGWTTAESWTNQTWSASYTRRDFVLASSAGSHLYWRLNITAANSATLAMAECNMYPDTAGKWPCATRFEFAFRAPGVDGAQEIHVLGRTYTSAGSGYYNVAFRGVRFWTDIDLDIGNIPTVSSEHSHLLANTAVQYWIVANGGRFVLLTRISGVYELSYCGFGLPYETPSNHPFPIIIAAPSNSNSRLVSDTSSADYRNPCDPGTMGAQVMIPSGQWREVRNRSGSGPDGITGTDSYGKTYPYSSDDSGSNSTAGLMRDAVDGSKPVLPIVIALPQDGHLWGEFDGIAWVSGFGNAAEALMQIGAVDWINFPNVYRSGYSHFAAIALD